MKDPSLAGGFSWAPTLENFAGITGDFKQFYDLEMQLILSVIIVTVLSKMYSTNKMS